VVIFGAIRLGLAIAMRLKNREDRMEMLETLIQAIGDDGKVTPFLPLSYKPLPLPIYYFTCIGDYLCRATFSLATLS